MKFLLRICILIIILFVSVSVTISQSLEFAIPPDRFVSGNPDEDIKSFAQVRNKSNNTINLKAKMTIISLQPGHKVYFCLGICYAPRETDYEMPDGDAVALVPGESTIDKKFFDVALAPANIDGTTIVKMTFMVLGNPADSVEYTVTFNAATPVFETDKIAFRVAEPVPNPASDFVNFNCELTDGINTVIVVIYDNLGNLIHTLNLNSQKIEKYCTAVLPNGTYYAVFNSGDEKKAVRRFVVLH